MRRKKFVAKSGPSGGCTLRLVEGSQYSGQLSSARHEAGKASKRYLYLGDSWFGSVQVAECLKCSWREQDDRRNRTSFPFYVDKEKGLNTDGHEFIGAVKTAHSWFPKKQIEKQMKSFPSGAYLVMECTAPVTGVKLVAVGYKYNTRKVLLFVMTKDAGHTQPGAPYIARFTDVFGNIKQRRVERPDCISKYFRHANAIDRHNHIRQGLLRLEELWLTKNRWFRIVTTVFGMTVVDCYLALRFHMQVEPFLNTSIHDFADMLAYDLINNPYSERSSVERRAGVLESLPVTNNLSVCTDASVTVPSSVGHTCSSSISPASVFSELTIDSVVCHSVVEQDNVSSSDQRGMKRKCVICKNDTRAMCGHPQCRMFTKTWRSITYVGTPVCKPSVGIRYGKQRTCIEQHAMNFAAAKGGNAT